VAAALLPVLLVACAGPSPAPPSRAEVQPEVQQALIDAHTRLIDAYEAGDSEAFLALLDTSRDLLLFHPMTEERFESVDEIREAMPRMFAKLGPLVWTDAHPVVIQRGEIAWITSNFLLDSPRGDFHFVGRSTEIWIRHAEGWRLIHGHWSQQPASSN